MTVRWAGTITRSDRRATPERAYSLLLATLHGLQFQCETAGEPFAGELSITAQADLDGDTMIERHWPSELTTLPG